MINYETVEKVIDAAFNGQNKASFSLDNQETIYATLVKNPSDYLKIKGVENSPEGFKIYWGYLSMDDLLHYVRTCQPGIDDYMKDNSYYQQDGKATIYCAVKWFETTNPRTIRKRAINIDKIETQGYGGTQIIYNNKLVEAAIEYGRAQAFNELPLPKQFKQEAKVKLDRAKHYFQYQACNVGYGVKFDGDEFKTFVPTGQN